LHRSEPVRQLPVALRSRQAGASWCVVYSSRLLFSYEPIRLCCLAGHSSEGLMSVGRGRPALFSPCENRACGARPGRLTWTRWWLPAVLAEPTPPATCSSIVG